MLCKNCGIALLGGDEAALFVCANCGLVHELGEDGLVTFPPLSAAVTTELAVAGMAQYLAVWRVAADVSAGEGSAWERIKRAAGHGPAYLYVPAFSLARAVIHQLGVSLTEAQPELELTQALSASSGQRPALRGVASGGWADADDGTPRGMAARPDFGVISPVVVGRTDARVLAHFVYLAVESREAHDLRSVNYELEPMGEDLLFIPAVWDPRYIHESNWRLLLREFDGLVA